MYIDALIIPVFLFLAYVISGKYGGSFILLLAIISTFLSTVLYVYIGMNVEGCPRFYSIPFGGCYYSDRIVSYNVIFWFCVVFSGFLTAYILWRKIFKKD